MRSVASQASLSLDCGVFEDEWAARFSVALGADRILIGRGLDAVVAKSAVRIVAVRTLDQALIDLVVKGHIEARFDIHVALKAESRLAGLEHCGIRSSVMHGVATDATHVGLGVRRADEIWMSACVASKAGGIYGLGFRSRKVKDLCLIAT
jgi:hypothetical protein